MGHVSVADICRTSLQRIAVDGGDVLHAMKSSDSDYAGFGEAYFTWILPNSIKAWKRHNIMTMNLIVPYGQVRFVFWTPNAGFREEYIGDNLYARLTVPPGIWFGFQGLSSFPSLVFNLSNITHDQNEIERIKKDDLMYSWQ